MRSGTADPRVSYRCRCPCTELHCADPSCRKAVSEQEQIVLVAEIGLVAAALDAHQLTDKATAVATALRLLPGMSGLSDSELNLIMARAGARSQDGQRWLCDTTNSIRIPALRRLAFRMAAMFAAWQGALARPAQEYLSALATAFNFSDAEAASLFAQATGWDVAAA